MATKIQVVDLVSTQLKRKKEHFVSNVKKEAIITSMTLGKNGSVNGIQILAANCETDITTISHQ
jgi:hypothetical protein